MKMDKVTQMGLDPHRTFSKVTGRDAEGRAVCRMRIDHRDHRLLPEDLGLWPKGTPVILEGTFGWGWLSEALKAAGRGSHPQACALRPVTKGNCVAVWHGPRLRGHVVGELT